MTWKHSLSPRPQRERSPCQLLLCGPPGGPRSKRRGRQVRRVSSASAPSVSPPTRSGRLGPCPSHPRGRRLRRQDRARGGSRCPSRFGLPRAPHPHARPLRPQGGARYTPQSLEPRRGPLSLPPSQVQSRRPAPRGVAVRLRCWGPAVPRLPRGLSSAAAGPAVPLLQCPPPDSHPGAGRPTPALRGRWSPSSEPRVTSCLRAPWQVAPRGARAPTSAWRPWARPFEGTLSLASGFPKAPCLSERPRPAVCLAQLCL